MENFQKSKAVSIQPKNDTPYVSKPVKRKILCILERDLPLECQVTDPDYSKYLFFDKLKQMDVKELLLKLIELCDEKLKSGKITPDEMHELIRYKLQAGLWERVSRRVE